LTLSEVVPLRGSKLRVAATIGEGSTVNSQQPKWEQFIFWSSLSLFFLFPILYSLASTDEESNEEFATSKKVFLRIAIKYTQDKYREKPSNSLSVLIF
jgi:hypothetical protein